MHIVCGSMWRKAAQVMISTVGLDADEPIAPEGVRLDLLPPGAAEWLFSDLLPWARLNAKRLDQGHRWCATLGRPPDPG